METADRSPRCQKFQVLLSLWAHLVTHKHTLTHTHTHTHTHKHTLTHTHTHTPSNTHSFHSYQSSSLQWLRRDKYNLLWLKNTDLTKITSNFRSWCTTWPPPPPHTHKTQTTHTHTHTHTLIVCLSRVPFISPLHRNRAEIRPLTTMHCYITPAQMKVPFFIFLLDSPIWPKIIVWIYDKWKQHSLRKYMFHI